MGPLRSTGRSPRRQSTLMIRGGDVNTEQWTPYRCGMNEPYVRVSPGTNLLSRVTPPTKHPGKVDPQDKDTGGRQSGEERWGLGGVKVSFGATKGFWNQTEMEPMATQSCAH